jgi:ABC-2 type transport system ATP-binding protein
MVGTENLGVRFGSRWALRGVSLFAEPASVLGLIGPSGCGKSTLLRALATLVAPAEGRAHVGGAEVLKEPWKVRHRVGYLPDQVGFYDALKVEEYLNFYADCHRLPGGSRRQRRIENLLELIDLQQARRQYVLELSRGMKQKLAIARCLIHDPEVLLLDDPASGLDHAARQDLRDLLGELRAMRKTILITSHVFGELNGLLTHVAVLDAGRLIHFGPAEERIDDLYQRLLPAGGDAA